MSEGFYTRGVIMSNAQVEREAWKSFISSYYKTLNYLHRLILSELSEQNLYQYHIEQVKRLEYKSTVAKLFAPSADTELLGYWNEHYKHEQHSISVSEHCPQEEDELTLLLRDSSSFEQGSFPGFIRDNLEQWALCAKGLSLSLDNTKTDGELLSSVYGLATVVHRALGFVEQKSLYSFSNMLITDYIDNNQNEQSNWLAYFYEVSSQLLVTHNDIMKCFCGDEPYQYFSGSQLVEGLPALLATLSDRYEASIDMLEELSAKVKPDNKKLSSDIMEQFSEQKKCLDTLNNLNGLHSLDELNRFYNFLQQYRAVKCDEETLTDVVERDFYIVTAAEDSFERVEQNLKAYLRRVHKIEGIDDAQSCYQQLCQKKRPHRKVHRAFLLLTVIEKFKTVSQQGSVSADDHLALLQLIDEVRQQNNQDRRLGQGNRFGKALNDALAGVMSHVAPRHSLLEARFGAKVSHEMNMLLDDVETQNRSRSHRRYIAIARKKQVLSISTWHLQRYKECEGLIREKESSEEIDIAIDTLFSDLESPQWDFRQRQMLKAYADTIARIKKIELNYMKLFEFDEKTIDQVSLEQLKVRARSAESVIAGLSEGVKLPARLVEVAEGFKSESIDKIKMKSRDILNLLDVKKYYESSPSLYIKKEVSQSLQSIRNAETVHGLLKLFCERINPLRHDHAVLQQAVADKMLSKVIGKDMSDFHQHHEVMIAMIVSDYAEKAEFIKKILVKVKHRYYMNVLSQSENSQEFFDLLMKIRMYNKGDSSWAETAEMKQLMVEKLVGQPGGHVETTSDYSSDNDSDTESLKSSNVTITLNVTNCMGQTIFGEDYLTTQPQHNSLVSCRS